MPPIVDVLLHGSETTLCAMNKHSQKPRSLLQSRGLIYRNETFEECKTLTFQIWRPVISGA
jgi:hypothetical protein